ncbi:MAG: ATP-binding protein [Pirellulaceae bacterium]|nr:two-component sensor histidine kinase [Planctomycetales bacterium]MCA9203045.1 two-component sensor histidine kinase [Planctomycetales bacterium]MCA9209918.1 two-component sensor histidine kinase [Planctomycetales bacterium]MCA9220165.1 two-component sensor histidine kinase [Planctomycetales bacterium]
MSPPPQPDSQQQQAQQQYEKLHSQYNELAELAGSLAHEIKNPLSVIRMNLELLNEDLSEAKTPNERRALNKVRIVEEQCVRLENMLNDFLRFARVRNLNLQPSNLNEQIEQVLNLFEVQARKSNIEIRRYLDADLPTVFLDRETIRSALINLVKNAFEAMDHDGELTARTYVTRTGVALDLIDTGCGMDERTAIKMFDAFFSTKDGGSGLGLPHARKVIEAHGARIDVQSELGRGTKFTIEFPAPARLATGAAAVV